MSERPILPSPPGVPQPTADLRKLRRLRRHHFWLNTAIVTLIFSSLATSVWPPLGLLVFLIVLPVTIFIQLSL